jgi:hypothetical protein
MTAAAASASPSSPVVGEPARAEVSLVRLYVLRATYLLLVVGLGAMTPREVSS